mmetsp:Transcript_45060/g.90944  ORF Transcript_45060/g.90944 Transcript_45060/m.90944 type:complete len:166 (+) Transcript_45060:160-657(+)
MKWGDRLDAFYPGGRESIADLGLSAGRKFDFDVELTDTMDSWRLALWAEGQGRGEELLGAVGRRYFEERRQLADHAMLLEAVEEVGLNTSEARDVLNSDAFFQDVVRHYHWAVEEQGIHSIPLFLISDPSGTFREAVHGSASVEEFAKVLRNAAAAEGRASEADL